MTCLDIPSQLSFCTHIRIRIQSPFKSVIQEKTEKPKLTHTNILYTTNPKIHSPDNQIHAFFFQTLSCCCIHTTSSLSFHRTTFPHSHYTSHQADSSCNQHFHYLSFSTPHSNHTIPLTPPSLYFLSFSLALHYTYNQAHSSSNEKDDQQKKNGKLFMHTTFSLSLTLHHTNRSHCVLPPPFILFFLSHSHCTTLSPGTLI